jgi:hypothetical protein
MSSFLQDIRFGGRTLLRQRGFAAIAILTLALGIGANTAIFSLLNPLIFRPLGVPQPERVCRVFSGSSGGNVYKRVSYPNYTDLRDHVQSFVSLAASSWPTPFTIGLGIERGSAAQSEIAWGAVVSGNYFTLCRPPTRSESGGERLDPLLILLRARRKGLFRDRTDPVDVSEEMDDVLLAREQGQIAWDDDAIETVVDKRAEPAKELHEQIHRRTPRDAS